MEEWRSGKDSKGRVAEAQWKLVMQGTKVLHRLPCRVIRIAPVLYAPAGSLALLLPLLPSAVDPVNDHWRLIMQTNFVHSSSSPVKSANICTSMHAAMGAFWLHCCCYLAVE